jgi:hypothetical protein
LRRAPAGDAHAIRRCPLRLTGARPSRDSIVAMTRRARPA